MLASSYFREMSGYLLRLVKSTGYLIVCLFLGCDDSPENSCNNLPSLVNSQLIENSIRVLSDDSLYGRWIQEDGIVKAQNFLSKELEDLGLEPLENNNFLSPF